MLPPSTASQGLLLYFRAFPRPVAWIKHGSSQIARQAETGAPPRFKLRTASHSRRTEMSAARDKRTTGGTAPDRLTERRRGKVDKEGANQQRTDSDGAG